MSTVFFSDTKWNSVIVAVCYFSYTNIFCSFSQPYNDYIITKINNMHDDNCVCVLLLTFHSKPATAIPPAAPVPARPINRPEPSELAKRDAPICGEQEFRLFKQHYLYNNVNILVLKYFFCSSLMFELIKLKPLYVSKGS